MAYTSSAKVRDVHLPTAQPHGAPRGPREEHGRGLHRGSGSRSPATTPSTTPTSSHRSAVVSGTATATRSTCSCSQSRWASLSTTIPRPRRTHDRSQECRHHHHLPARVRLLPGAGILMTETEWIKECFEQEVQHTGLEDRNPDSPRRLDHGGDRGPRPPHAHVLVREQQGARRVDEAPPEQDVRYAVYLEGKKYAQVSGIIATRRSWTNLLRPSRPNT